jgi:hypothetical protein
MTYRTLGAYLISVACLVAACGDDGNDAPDLASGGALGTAGAHASGDGGAMLGTAGGGDSAGIGGSSLPGEGGTSAGGGDNAAGADAGNGAGGFANAAGAGGDGHSATGGKGGHHEPDVEPSGPLPVFWLTLPEKPDPDDIGEPEEPGALRVIEAHDGMHANPDGFATAPATLEAPINLHVRGRSSSRFDKKSFSLELEDASGNQVKLPLLGLPKESDWVLHGPYSDKTYLRNALMYWLGRELYRLPDGTIERGRWSPRTRFVEIYINGRYWGVYVAVEKVKADADRVDVDRPALDAAAGDLSGGYIIRREGGGDAADGKDWVSGVNHLVYTHHYPRLPDMSAAQREYIRDYFDDFEAMMEGSSWNDPKLGYPAWLDVTSVLDYFLAMEWTNNVDGYFKSVYLVKHAASQGGKLAFGPLWDFDIALGNANYRNGDDPNNWVYRTPGTEKAAYTPPGNVPYIPPYVTRLWNDGSFRRKLRCRWEALRQGPLDHAPIEAKIDTWVEALEDAELRDHARWPVIGARLWPNPVAWGSYAEEIAYLKQFMRQRFQFLDVELAKLAPEPCP